MSEFKPRVFQEIFGDMVANIIANSPLTDVNIGSVVTTMLEIAALEDDEQYFQMQNIIQAFSLDTTSGDALDDRAYEYGLVRRDATKATTTVKIGDSSITKVSTGIFSGLPGPSAGDTAIEIDDAAGFTAGGGTVIVGRGKSNVEVVSYSSITVNINSATLNLTSGLVNNHDTSETVILSQGGNRVITSGTIVSVPSSDLKEQVDFSLNDNAVILDGESEVEDVAVTAVQSGADSNVPIGYISTFDSPPFATATVTNTNRVTNGSNQEIDQELRDRIRKTIQSLSRGTAASIVSALIGSVDTTENKRIVSASIVEPTTIPDIVKVFIDDGTGLIPSYENVGVETIIEAATGGEQFLKIDNVPIVKAFAETIIEGPYDLSGGETLDVEVAGKLETITFLSSDFAVLGAATATEVRDRLRSSELFDARLTGDGKSVRIFSRSSSYDDIRVTGGTSNVKLGFPTDVVYTTRIYKEDSSGISLLSKDGRTAEVESATAETYDFSSWSFLTLSADDKYGVDNDMQVIWLFPSDFSTPAAGSAEEVVTAINQRAKGFSAEVSSNGTKVRLLSDTLNDPTSEIRVFENFDYVWSEESSVLVDRSAEFASDGSDIQIFAADLDYVYFGMLETRFSSIFVVNSVNASANIDSVAEYWDGSAWTAFGVSDSTLGFQQDGEILFQVPFDWATTTVETDTGYFIRLQRTNAAAITSPTEDRIRICGANEIFAFPVTEDVGASKDYTLNRFIGQIELETPLVLGDKLTVGSELTRPSVISGSNELFDLSTGPTLTVEIDGVSQNYTFVTGDFAAWGSATAAEVAAVLNREFGGMYADVVSGKVRIRSNSWRSIATIQVIAGGANTIFNFPTTLNNALTSHAAFVESVAGPYTFAASDFVIFVVDDNVVDTIQAPLYYESTFTGVTDASNLIDTTLQTVFPNASDLIGMELELTIVANPPPAVAEKKEITNYVPATGVVTLASALTDVPEIGDTFQIIPNTPDEIVAMWNNRKITTMSDKLEVTVSNGGDKVQVASLNYGGDASVEVTGGPGNSGKLDFSIVKVIGISGYRYWKGLLRLAQWIIDGREDDQEIYPGIRAAGNQVEVLEPLSRNISVSVTVTPEEGITLSSLVDSIRSSISEYVNGLGVGDDVIVSEIIAAVKALDGVFDIQVLSPTVNIAIADDELARVDSSSISIG